MRITKWASSKIHSWRTLKTAFGGNCICAWRKVIFASIQFHFGHERVFSSHHYSMNFSPLSNHHHSHAPMITVSTFWGWLLVMHWTFLLTGKKFFPSYFGNDSSHVMMISLFVGRLNDLDHGKCSHVWQIPLYMTQLHGISMSVCVAPSTERISSTRVRHMKHEDFIEWWSWESHFPQLPCLDSIPYHHDAHLMIVSAPSDF